MSNILDDELNAMDQVFIASQHATLGSAQPWADPFFDMYEICQEFESAHLIKIGQKDGVYVDDDAFPDAFNHTAWQMSQLIDHRKEGYDVVRAQEAFRRVQQPAQRNAVTPVVSPSLLSAKEAFAKMEL